MAVIQLPRDMEGVSSVPCVVCLTMQPLTNVAVCLQGDFVCNLHFKQNAWLVQGMARYLARRQRFPQATHAASGHRGNVFVEVRGFGVWALAWDLAHHLFLRQLPGKAVVLSGEPVVTVSAVRKQWKRLERRVVRERAATLKADLIRDLNDMEHYLDQLPMTIKKPRKAVENEVCFVLPSPELSIPSSCHTLYVTTPMDDAAFNALVANMPDHGLVVRYVSQEQPATYLRLHTWRHYDGPNN